jgi:hypothetical protein
MVELLAGVVVAFVAVAVVLQPLFGGRAVAQSGGPAQLEVEFEDIEESASPKVQALLALKEIEFDHATGKLSDTDYDELKAKYSKRALEAIESEERGDLEPAAADADVSDAAEELVRLAAEGKLAMCPTCGPRPEADAAFCSDCGAQLTRPEPKAEAPAKGRFCEACGNAVSPKAKFCDACGAKVGGVTAGSAG